MVINGISPESFRRASNSWIGTSRRTQSAVLFAKRWISSFIIQHQVSPSPTFEWRGIASTSSHKAWMQLLFDSRFHLLLNFWSTERWWWRIILFPIFSLLHLYLRSLAGIVLRPLYKALRASIAARRQWLLLINWLNRFGILHKYVDICVELLKSLIKTTSVSILITTFFSSSTHFYCILLIKYKIYYNLFYFLF